ncbi:MAG: rpoA 1 [Phycisphaerales bacterium]|jgi:DNA-directed RNA polymerase subunit alpha|nr:rpoA 1 [Phycisphaerales bacterium]
MSELTVSSINERAAEEYFKKGQDAETQALHERAVEFYERTLNENPDHESAAFRLALLYDRRAEDAKAIELLERISTSAPVHINALINLAILYEDNNHYDEAHRCLDAVLRTDPNHQRARLYMKDVESARSQYYDEDAERRGDRRDAILNIPISDFELSVRSRNCLKKMNLRSLGDLLRTSEAELLSYKNFGETSLNEIKALLASKGLRLGQAAEDKSGAAAAVAGGLPGAIRKPSVATGNVPAELGGKSVADLELSVRSRKALQRLNIATIGELASRTEAELLGCKNFGQTSLNEIKQQLTTMGLGLRKLEE